MQAACQEHRFRLLVESVVDYAIFMLDPDGTVLTWNVGAERLKGYTADGDHRPAVLASSIRPRRSRAGWPQHELDVAAADGPLRGGGLAGAQGRHAPSGPASSSPPCASPDGSLEGFAKVTRDLTEKRLRDEALRQSEEQFRLLLESVKDYAIFMLDPEGTILTWNSGAEAIKGYAASEVLGPPLPRCSSPPRTSLEGKPAGRAGTSRARAAGPRAKAGGCARTAACSGPTPC